MKQQYFADVNDYKKYGLLRALAGPDTRLLVAWMLTPNDGRSDGNLLGYLRRPEKWRRLDPDLFDFLESTNPATQPRSVAAIEAWPGMAATFLSAIVPDSASGRDEWTGQLIERARVHDLVFFDPDNGIEIKSRPRGRKDSSKYVLWRELEGTWAAGSSLVVYQHFPREPRQDFMERVARELQRRLGCLEVAVLRTPYVAFFVVPQEGWIETIQQRSRAFARHWDPYIRLERPLDRTG